MNRSWTHSYLDLRSECLKMTPEVSLVISTLSLVLEMYQVITGYLVSHSVVNIMEFIQEIFIQSILCSIPFCVLGTECTAPNKADKNPHPHRAYNLVGKKKQDAQVKFMV